MQHVLQADGITHSFTCPLHNHDALVLCNSSMILMLSSVFIGGDRNKPVLTVTDKAYRRTDHFKPIHTDAELCMMAPNERAIGVEFDKKHKKPRMAVEYSFNQQVTKFCHTDDYRRHWKTQNGTSNWQHLHCGIYRCFSSTYIHVEIIVSQRIFYEETYPMGYVSSWYVHTRAAACVFSVHVLQQHAPKECRGKYAAALQNSVSSGRF